MLLLKKAALNYAFSQSKPLTQRIIKEYYAYLMGTHKDYINMRKAEMVQGVKTISYYNEVEKMMRISVIEYICEVIKHRDYFDYASHIITVSDEFSLIYTKNNLIRRYTERLRFNELDEIGLKALEYTKKHNLNIW